MRKYEKQSAREAEHTMERRRRERERERLWEFKIKRSERGREREICRERQQSGTTHTTMD